MREEGLGAVLLGLEKLPIGSSSRNGERVQLPPKAEQEAWLSAVGFGLSRERMGAGVGWREEEAPLLTPGVVESGFLQELLKDCNFSGTNFGGNCQMHLALVRDRRGESKNNRGRAATQCECRAGNRIPMAGAGGGDCDEAALYQSHTRVARAPPGSPALGEHPNG